MSRQCIQYLNGIECLATFYTSMLITNIYFDDVFLGKCLQETCFFLNAIINNAALCNKNEWLFLLSVVRALWAACQRTSTGGIIVGTVPPNGAINSATRRWVYATSGPSPPARGMPPSSCASRRGMGKKHHVLLLPVLL